MERIRDSRLIAANTRELRAMARDAHQRGLNRQMKPAQFKLLDPRGTHIISPQFMHDKADGKLVEPHLRCNVHIKLIGKNKEIEIVMDIPMRFMMDHVSTDEIDDAVKRGVELHAMESDDPKRLMTTHVDIADIKDETHEARPNEDNLRDEVFKLGEAILEDEIAKRGEVGK